MTSSLRLPAALAERAHKRGWFKPADAQDVLEWLAKHDGRFLGFDVAEQMEDGKWMLLIDPIQDLSKEADRDVALKLGREFLEEHQSANRIFEPVWEGRNT